MTREPLMKACGVAATLLALTAPPLFAQEPSVEKAGGYLSAFGGPVWTGGNSTGNAIFEGGVRIARHTMIFGNIGHFADLQADLQPSLDAATTALSSEGLGVTGGGTLPAWYGIAGVRAEMPASKRAWPYVLGGLGAARLNPTQEFMFTSGMMPDGSIPDVGTDVTAALASEGSLAAPQSSTALMLTFGGGVELPVVKRWVADVGYRYSRIAAESSLSADPLNTNAMTFGFGYRF